MATPYTDIYEKVTQSLQSYKLASLSQAVFESYVDAWIDEASSVNFLDCKTDLLDRDEVLKQFNQTLTSREQWIITYSICMSWINVIVSDESLLQNTIGDRDYSTYSPANLLKSLLSVQEQFRGRLVDALEKYSWETFNFIDGF
jgi:hypothetical protein